MQDSAFRARYVRFGAFELDVRSSELRKGRTRLVPDQSIEVLKALVEQPGELVTRDSLRERLWPANHHVDFEHGLNAAVRRLRDALGDVLAGEVPTRLAVANLPQVWLRRPTALGVASIAVALLGSVGAEWMSWPVPPPAPPAPPTPIFKHFTVDRGSLSGPTLSADGRFVVFRSELNGRVTVWMTQNITR